MQYQVNPSLSIRLDQKTSALTIGLTPVKGVVLEENSEVVCSVLQLLETPRKLSELVQPLSNLHTISPQGCADILDDLRSLGVLQPCLERSSRYSRHELYFSFSGIPYPVSTKVLGQKKIVLIGAGGIGSSCAMLLGAAGIGSLVLVDPDRVELSNLSRSVLFTEGDLSQPKVTACAARIKERNQKINVADINLPFEASNAAAILPHLENADFIILSADSGADVHEFTQSVASRLKIPYLNAGYVETFGVIGPTILPGHELTAKLDAESQAGQLMALPELNPAFQAPSYGPLNMLVSSIAVNEAIRYCLGLRLETENQRLIIDSFD